MKISIAKDYGETTFVTGIRAFAALSVVMIHSGGAGLRGLGAIGNHLADLGRTGVYAFYVISGFSVAASFAASRGFRPYAEKRFFRIAPLYYFWLTVGFFFMGQQYSGYWRTLFHTPFDIYDILMHFSFLSSLDYRVANSALGVEWSISVEAIWYLFLPLLLYFTRSKITAVLSIPLAVLFYLTASKLSLHGPFGANNSFAFQWSPLKYALSYVLGVAAFRLRPLLPLVPWAGDLVIASTIGVLALWVSVPGLTSSPLADEFVLVSFLTFTWLLCISNDGLLARTLLLNRPALFIGTISYGIYLCHFLILDCLTLATPGLIGNPAVKFVVLVILASAVSYVMYCLIERPGQIAGGRLQRLRPHEGSRVATAK